MNSWKDNISFILVEPKEPGNIGASARALKNMGFRNLALVKPGEFLNDEAREMACNAADILEKASVHAKFKDAVREKNLVIGTTRRLGKSRGLIIPLQESVRKIITAARRNTVAVLFGRERTGLTNHEVAQCGFLVTIPSDPESPSLNLAQSVLLVAYELSRGTYTAASPAFMTQKEVGPLYARIESILRMLEFVPRGDTDLEKKIMKNLRHLIGRAGLTEWELKMLQGLCSQVERKIKGGTSGMFL